MINNQNSRRNFLSSMAILSAGAAFGSVTDFISPGNPAKDLKRLWDTFCTQNNGYPLLSLSADKTVMDTCKGHFPKNGEMVFFSMENLLAQPTWIYWGKNKNQANDVIITFFNKNQEQTKAFRINCFELEALTALSAGMNENSVLNSLRENIKTDSRNGINPKGLVVKTNIQKGKHAKTIAIHSTKKISIDSKLIYHS